jgi:phage terminase large subunit
MCDTRYAGFVGGIGTGKSRGICYKGILKAEKNPGSLGCITAPTYPMLRDATKRTFFEICPPELVAFRNDSENVVGLKTNDGRISEVLFRSTSDPESLRGPNLLWWGMDEAALSMREAYLILAGRLRAGDPLEQQGFLGTTPKGFNWVYDLFGPAQRDPKFSAFYAETEDNVFLPVEFIHDVYAQYEGLFAQQELKGKFVAHEGLVYGDLFHYENHIGNFTYNPALPVDLTWDFGYPKAESVLAIQQDAFGNVFVIDELYHLRTLTEDIVAEVKSKIWFDKVIDCVCDDSRPDMILRLLTLGIPAREAHKGKILDGIKKVRHLLSYDAITKQPLLHIDKRCEMLIKEFGLYRWKDRRTETDEFPEIPIDAYDHSLDGLRYWCTSKWRQPGLKKPESIKKPAKRVMAYQRMR